MWNFRYEKWHGFSIGKKKKQFRRKLIITDTAGQEEMSSLLDTHIQNKDAGNFYILKYFPIFQNPSKNGHPRRSAGVENCT